MSTRYNLLQSVEKGDAQVSNRCSKLVDLVINQKQHQLHPKTARREKPITMKVSIVIEYLLHFPNQPQAVEVCCSSRNQELLYHQLHETSADGCTPLLAAAREVPTLIYQRCYAEARAAC